MDGSWLLVRFSSKSLTLALHGLIIIFWYLLRAKGSAGLLGPIPSFHILVILISSSGLTITRGIEARSKPMASERKIGTFDILKVMTDRNMDIRLSTLDNITNLELKKGNSFIRIGFSGDVVNGIANNEFVGGLLLARKEQWEEIRRELEKAGGQ